MYNLLVSQQLLLLLIHLLSSTVFLKKFFRVQYERTQTRSFRTLSNAPLPHRRKSIQLLLQCRQRLSILSDLFFHSSLMVRGCVLNHGLDLANTARETLESLLQTPVRHKIRSRYAEKVYDAISSCDVLTSLIDKDFRSPLLRNKLNQPHVVAHILGHFLRQLKSRKLLSGLRLLRQRKLNNPFVHSVNIRLRVVRHLI